MSWAPHKPIQAPDWDDIYRQGTPPWDTGKVAAELVRVVEDGLVKRGTALELGCGTGADAIYLAKLGFEMTAVDISAIAIERSRCRAEQHDALLRLVQADVLKFGQTAGRFDFIYDAGFYHCLRQTDLDGLLDTLWRVTGPGSLYLALVGGTGEEAEGGPPQVTEDEIHDELGRLFEFIHIRPIRLASPRHSEGFPGWSCLMRRPVLNGR